jgi:hypothetical protein
MPENKTNSPQVKPGPRVFEWLKDQQYVRRKATGREPTYEDLLAELLDSYEQASRIQQLTGVIQGASASDDGEVKTPYAPDHMQDHGMLERILRDGTPEQLGGIRSNLRAFCSEIRLAEIEGLNRPPQSRKVAG